MSMTLDPKTQKMLEKLQRAAAEKKTPQQAPQDEPKTETQDGPKNPNEDRFAALQASGLDRGSAREIVEQQAIYGPGLHIGRILRAQACAHREHRYGPDAVIGIVRDVYHDKDLATLMELHQSRALSAGVPSEGGALIPETFSEDFIQLLYPNTVIFKLGARSVPMPTGNLTMASLTSGSTASYVGENADQNASQPTFGEKTYQAKKLICIVPVSNDLLRSASPRADQIVRDDAVRQVAVKMDYTAMMSQGVGSDPRGMAYDPNRTQITCGALTADSPTLFIKGLLAVYVSMVGGKLGWAFNQDTWATFYNMKTTTGAYLFREEMNQGKLLGFPFEITQQIPTVSTVSHIFFGDWAQLLVAQQGQLEVAISDSAAYLDSTGTMRASFSRDQTIVRLIDRHDIGLRLGKAMGHANDVVP